MSRTPHGDAPPRGAALNAAGAAFSVLCPDAERVMLLLFDDARAARPAREVRTERAAEGTWHVDVPGVAAGQRYLFRAEGPGFDPAGWLLDPRAMAVDFGRRWGDRSGHAPGRYPRPGPLFPRGVVIDHAFDWGGDRAPRTPWEDTVLYELHVRGFTRGRGAGVRHPGTYRGLVEKIPYLRDLGVTAVELLPVQEFDELEFHHQGGARRHLLNYWGYSTLAFFAPQSRYAAAEGPEGAVLEFKEMVRAFHDAGIEVILDVVLNHTAEGDVTGPTYSFRGLAESVYYLLDASGRPLDFTGCGNTFNVNHPLVVPFVVDVLRHWVERYHVDGFRFDLATVLTRGGPGGEVMVDPPLIRAIDADPVLREVKRIAEPWDAAGERQVGAFPGRDWSEWNDRFRDEVRGFWLGYDGPLRRLATRLCGSDDLYGGASRAPRLSVNMVTCHDGFTLADLVSYERKHNLANGEENRDGAGANFSANHGHEGPSDDPAIAALRRLQRKNLVASLLVSAGTPHLLAGDEFGQTQHGNNNAYCQDGDTAWLDWTGVERDGAFHAFVRRLLAFRRDQGTLRRRRFFTGHARGGGDITWYGANGHPPDWERGRAVACRLDGRRASTGREADAAPLLLAFNAGHEAATFPLPEEDGAWQLAWFTQETPPDLDAGGLTLAGMSVAALAAVRTASGTDGGV